MIRLTLILMVAGGFLVFFGYKEMQLSSIADAQPQEMTVAELIKNGPGDNAHIIVTDLWLLEEDSVIQYPEDEPNKINKLWAPVVPRHPVYGSPLEADLRTKMKAKMEQPAGKEVDQSKLLKELAEADKQAYKKGDEIKLIVYSTDVKNVGQVGQFNETGKVQGLIINKVDKLGSEELEWLNKSLKINPDNVLILEHNRKPAGSGKVVLMLGGGALLLLAGPAVFFFARRGSRPAPMQDPAQAQAQPHPSDPA